jgi:hypothetical protein
MGAFGGDAEFMKKPPRSWIEHVDNWRSVPMAYWVHVQQGKEPWGRASEFDPPAPGRDGALGYAVLCVDSGGMTFRFSSRAQLDECIRTLSARPLPSSRRLAALRGGAGPNGHWLSRLPASVKSPKGRERVVVDLGEVAKRLGPGSLQPVAG